MILVVGHSQHLKVWQVWQVWQGEIKDEYEAKEDTGFEEGNHEMQTGNQDWGKYSELPVLPSKPIVYDDERLSKPGLEQGAGHLEEPEEGKVLVDCDAIWLRKTDLAVALSRDITFRENGWPECCSPALIEGSRFWVRRIVDIPSALEGGTKIRREQGREKEKGDICTTQQEPTKTKRKKKRRPKAGMWCTIKFTIEEVSSAAQGRKNGVEVKKESLRTSGCDKIYNEGTHPQRSSPPLRSAEDVCEVGSRVDLSS
jgi:hypothetical protein